MLEDIDKAPLDLVAGLSSLIETRTLYLPDRRETVTAHPHFRLFATRSVRSTSQDPYSIPSLQYFAEMWFAITCDAPSLEEVVTILEGRFPSLPPAVRDMLLGTYLNFNSRTPTSGTRLREFTLRDLMKAAARIHGRINFNSESDYVTERLRLLCVAELFDVFVASIREPALSSAAALSICSSWDISVDLAISQLVEHHPELLIGDSTLQIGRVVLDRLKSSTLQPTQFGNTSHSLRYMERIAACIAACEPTLLVGETGGGKTTMVQLLANLANQKLLVQNLSLATDSSDLIGGYRPVSMTELFQPVYQQFITIFAETFSSAQNAEFMHAITVSFRKQQWRKLMKAFEKAIEYAYKKISTFENLDCSPLHQKWRDFSSKVDRFSANLERYIKY